MRKYLKDDATWWIVGFINLIASFALSSPVLADNYLILVGYLAICMNLFWVTFIPDRELGYCYLLVIFGGSSFRPISRIRTHYGKRSYNYKWWGISVVIYVMFSLIAMAIYPWLMLFLLA